jgi:hypothetical protein
MILEGSDFLNRPYRIPNQFESKDFSSWLQGEERTICNSILGVELTSELFEALNSSSMETRFDNLINGNGLFLGLKNVLKPSVYYSWLDVDKFKLTATGIITNDKPANSTAVPNNFEFQVKAWNEFVKLVGHVGCKDNSTMWYYMNSNKVDFPTWKFTPQKLKNRFLF